MWFKQLIQIAILFINISKIKCIELEVPELDRVEIIEPAGVYVKWKPVAQSLEDPISGFKIRIYEVPESSEMEVKLINAEQYPAMVRTDEALEEFSTDSTLPVSREISFDRKTKSAVIDGLKYNKVYEVRVLAYKGSENGPLSESVRFKILKDTDYRAVVTRTVKGCHVSVAREVETAGETYPYVYNAYF